MDNVAQTFQDGFYQGFEIDEQCIPFKGCHFSCVASISWNLVSFISKWLVWTAVHWPKYKIIYLYRLAGEVRLRFIK